uniref:NADH-ubiquinone oxidoreductase chain 2 n=1 Tax=Argiope bruennichi TaxID=94029 RepID=A0A7M4C8U1_ARGBR|nr:NADH dehydrogenase subunit 2 [Argiope bruennichi]
MFAQSVGFFSVFYILSIILTVSCSDWFLIWVGLEINMMSFIALVYDRSSSSVETCMKYFFIQSLGSGILMMMFYSEFYWFEYICLGVLSYKMGGGPFYFWFPAVCDSLSWGSCLLLMTVQKVLPLLMISFLVSMFLWFIIISSLVMGALGSLNQKSVKRLMAFSSVHHIGWILMGNFLQENLWMIYLAMYSAMITGIIWTLMKDKILEVGMLGKMSSKWSFVLGMLSLGGMPPMLGFYLKWWLFYNLMIMDFSLLILMVLMSVLMFYVYLRISYSVIMGSVSMNGWNSINMNKNIMSLDLLYMMGLNVGVSLWFML